MKRVMIFLMGCCLAWQVAEAQQPPLIKGQVKHLNGEVAANLSIKLPEPGQNGIEGGTDEFGLFSIQLPAGWDVGQEVTLLVSGYEVIRPWDGKLIIKQTAGPNADPEQVLIARPKLANVVRNTVELARIIHVEKKGFMRATP